MLSELLHDAARDGLLRAECVPNIEALLAGASTKQYGDAVRELAEAGEWAELNDRFYRTLAFGTGGLRGRTIGRVIAPAERGSAPDGACPEFPCVGTNAMNFYNIRRATRGLAAYVWDYFLQEGRQGRPKVCLCHDTRYYSRAFAELSAEILAQLGCDAFLFHEFRSTPELSFAIRWTGAQAGVNITASHNPPAYNGYKVYFEDGGQIVEPHASGIIARVHEVEGEFFEPLPAEERGQVKVLGPEVDEAYLERLETLFLEPEVVRKAGSLRVVFSPLHGTGATIVEPLLRRLGVTLDLVEEQCVPDGGFPTVASPNPEEVSALAMGVALAQSNGADLVVATDPDADRMGVAARNSAGDLELLNGNQIGSLLAWHRCHRMRDLGLVTEENRARATLVKTLVTTDLQTAIAQDFGVRCVQTLTGFKYIGAKLKKYEEALAEVERARYFFRPESETRAARLAGSTFFIFGGEESYGYSGADFVRDKDANSAVAMLVEAAAWARQEGLTLWDLLDRLYVRYGFYLEAGHSLAMEGADGAARMARLVDSYAATPPREMDGRAVEKMTNHATEDIRDEEGDLLPREAMMMFSLTGGYRVAVRPSGTEPKIKYYLFGYSAVPEGELPTVKKEVQAALVALWEWIRRDAIARGEG
jgi:phosphoglucomutase